MARDPGKPVDPVIAEARKRWTRCADAESQQRERILKAKQFRALEQWPPAIKAAREGSAAIAGQAPQPARPCLVVDRLSQPVRQVSNTIKNADFGFDVMPNGFGADTETADIFKGYLRRVQNQSRGESPVEWAADGAIEGGIGWFRLRTEYVHETWDQAASDEAFDQELRMERIANNLTVYCDPSAMRPTRSDALYMFVTEDMDRDEFVSKYPKADLRGLEDFEATGDLAHWVDKDMIRVAEYWRVTFKEQTLTLGDKTRKVRTPVVKGSKINAIEELETWDWVGSRIPLIPILGEELNVDGQCVLRGIIEMGMDAQRMVNYTYSAAIEIFALGSKSPYIVSAESVANYKAIWDTANVANYAWLPFDEYVDGKQYARPQRDQAEAPIAGAVALLRTSEEAIKASTSTGDASLGNTNPNERSGKALQALQAQSDLANSNYPDNVRRAIIYAAELMVEIIPKITRPGQILHILGMDDEPEQVMVGKPFTKGPDGVPQEANVPPEVAKLKASLAKFYDLTQGTYAVTVTVGKASATRREEGAAALGDLIPHLPPEMQAKILPDYIKQLSFPGAQGIAEKLEPPNPQEGGDPKQMQQVIQQLQQQVQQAGEMLKTDQVKVQGSLQEAQIKAQADGQRAQLDAQVKIEIAKMDNAARIEVARIGAAKGALDAQAAAQEERLSTGLQVQHEAEQAALDRAHEVGMGAMSAQQQAQAQAADQAHQQQQAAQQTAAAADQQAAQQQHEAALAQQQQQAQAEQAAQVPAGAGG
jgi:Phage P22-like portal protein